MLYERKEKCGNWLLEKAIFRKVIEGDRKSSITIASLHLVNGSVTRVVVYKWRSCLDRGRLVLEEMQMLKFSWVYFSF